MAEDTQSSVSCDEGSCSKKILKPGATEASIQNGLFAAPGKNLFPCLSSE